MSSPGGVSPQGLVSVDNLPTVKRMTSGPAQPHTAFLKCLLALCLQKADSNQIFIKENTVKREFLAADKMYRKPGRNSQAQVQCT